MSIPGNSRFMSLPSFACSIVIPVFSSNSLDTEAKNLSGPPSAMNASLLSFDGYKLMPT